MRSIGGAVPAAGARWPRRATGRPSARRAPARARRRAARTQHAALDQHARARRACRRRRRRSRRIPPGACGSKLTLSSSRAVAVVAEHVERDEARAGEIALVAEDAVELQRMADRSRGSAASSGRASAAGPSCRSGSSGAAAVPAPRAATRGPSCSRKPARSSTSSPPCWQKPLYCPALERRCVSPPALRGDLHRRRRELPLLLGARAVAGDLQLFGLHAPQRGMAVDDAGIAAAGGGAHLAQPAELLGQRGAGWPRRPAGVAARAPGLAHVAGSNTVRPAPARASAWARSNAARARPRTDRRWPRNRPPSTT